MVKAYVFAITKSGAREKVASAKHLKEKHVKDIAKVYGKYDLVVKVEVKKLSDLNKFVSKLREIKGVEKTTTMISEKS